MSCGYKHKVVENNIITIMDYNDKSNFNKKVEFIDINLLYNKLNS